MMSGKLILILATVYAYMRHPRLISHFRRKLGSWPNPAVPRTYHEKMLWRRIFGHDPRFTQLGDKLAVKRYLAERHPDLPFAELRWSGSDPADIPDELIAEDVFLKANHGSSFNLRLGPDTDRAEMEHLARGWLRRKYGRKYRETGYWDIDRQLLIEEALSEDGHLWPYDLKLYTAGGRVIGTFIRIKHPGEEPFAACVDRDGNHIEVVTDDFGPSRIVPPLPSYAAMVRWAEVLSEDFDSVRIDFIACDTAYRFGEYTFYSQGGMDWRHNPDHSLPERITERWDLRRSWPLQHAPRGLRGRYFRALHRHLDSEP